MKNTNDQFLDRPVTNQGAQLIKVQYRDKLTGEYYQEKQVPRAFLAKMYHEQRVTHAINGVPVIDI